MRTLHSVATGMTRSKKNVIRAQFCSAVTGASSLEIEGSVAVVGNVSIAEGDAITIDGSTGDVFLGLTPLVEPEPLPELDRLLEWADEVRTLGVRANADSGSDAARARAAGAEGIGLARTEHMFMEAERLPFVQKMILAEIEVQRLAAAAQAENALSALRSILALPDGQGLVLTTDLADELRAHLATRKQ